MSDGGAALIWSPFGSEEEARTVCGQLVEEKLVACANILPPMTSIFSWEGAVDTASEVAVLFKTDARLLEAAIARLASLHPYDTPAIVGWRADSAAEATCGWLGGLVAGRETP